jgi:hypothetical protein
LLASAKSIASKPPTGKLRERIFQTTETLWQRYGVPMVLHGGSATYKS